MDRVNGDELKRSEKLIILPAHAKINLTLDILGTLPGGYHELRSVMQALELHDTLEITPAHRGGIEISCDSAAVPLGPENLVYQAAELLMQETGCSKSVRINIQKRIPLAAGLGGGSADAAAALAGLNQLWSLGLPPAVLVKLGARIGADIPFFIHGKTALVTGMGEKVFPLPPPPPVGVVLVKPDFGVSTALVYRLFDDFSPAPAPGRSDRMIKAIEKADINDISFDLGNNLGNDLEPVVASLHPEIRDIKGELKKAGATGAEMSGSGPTVFALTENIEKAVDLARAISKNNRVVIATRFKV